MDARSLQLLELPKILDRFAAHCDTSLGVELVQSLKPSTQLDDATERLADTTEAVAFLATRRIPPFGGITDVRPLTKRAHAAGVLTPDELLAVADTLTGLRRLAEVITGPEGRVLQRLLKRAWRITPQLEVEHAIRAAIEPSSSSVGGGPDSARAAVKDDASEDLRRIRRAMQSIGEQIQTRLRRLLGNSNFVKYLQEPIFTLRDDRYVVPVKAAHRGEVKGMLHDRSGSGSTLFIEPQELVDLNNEVRRFKLDERDEIERLLRKLSHLVGRHHDVTVKALAAAAELDFVFAKARLAEKMNATCPTLRDDGIVDVKQARHPLVEGEVVPIDLRLGADFDALFITGPNTGGKTVSLKTLGLLTLMAQCGLFVPAASGAQFNVFARVCADIGDEQSIEQNLSTFSSHVRRIIRFLQQADARTLVLLDEIGAGTDPDEGAALGKAVTHALLQAGAKLVVTTHYGELKLFAAAEPRLENASVEFDLKTLRPTFHLRIGVPGSSNAFSIAQRLGMPWALIKRARHYLRRDRFEAAKVIRQLERSQHELEREAELATQARTEVEQRRDELDELMAKAEAERQQIVEAARADALTLVRRAQAEADDILRRLRDQPRESRSTEQARAAMRALSETVREVTPSSRPPIESTAPAASTTMLVAGDTVWIASLKLHGTLLSAPDARDRVTVQIGAATVELRARDVQVSTLPVEKTVTPAVSTFVSAASVSSELHLRGMKVEVALPLLDKYLDDALVAQLDRVRIVHGKGAGVIKKVVHEMLRAHPHVRSFALGQAHEGGDGVTVVQF